MFNIFFKVVIEGFFDIGKMDDIRIIILGENFVEYDFFVNFDK